MSYLALYRKYRPLTFADVVGQDHITEVLKNQIVTNKISHAYIFNGIRGTGKTSTAKIFARAINCLNPKDGEPCNECENCKSILSGDTTDFVEMDAASNNSIENIRAIKQEVMYSATTLKYRVYIIDEVHMLSANAFNALLKTLEEPPENVVFVLATTEEHKILPTILSRCVRFEFKKISEKNICDRLKDVLEKDGVKYEEDAIKHIAKVADGGMRDGLSILERCIDDIANEVTYKKVIEIIGGTNKETLEELAKGILTYNVKSVENSCQEIIDGGKNLRNITSNLLTIFMEIMTYIATGKGEGVSEEIINAAKDVSLTRISKIMDVLGGLDEEIRFSVTGNVIFKARILELTVGNLASNEKDLIDKIKNLELRIEKLEKKENTVKYIEKQTQENNPKDYQPKEIAIEKEKTEQRPNTDKNIEEKTHFKDMAKVIKAASDSDNIQLFTALNGTVGFEENGKVVFETKNAFSYDILRKEDVEQSLKDIIREVVGEEKLFRIDLIKEVKKETNGFESFMANSGVPFEVID